VRGSSRTLGYYANLELPKDAQRWIGTERVEP
jgi:hypothetical protein